MTQEQRNRRRERLALFYFWWLIVGSVAILTIEPLLIDGWTYWYLPYFAFEILLLACLYPRLVRIQHRASRFLFRRLFDCD
jgi:hypothetical protein